VNKIIVSPRKSGKSSPGGQKRSSHSSPRGHGTKLRTESTPICIQENNAGSIARGSMDSSSNLSASKESDYRAVPKRLTMHTKHNSEGSPRRDRPHAHIEVDIISQIAELEKVIEAEEDDHARPKPLSPKRFSIGHSGQILHSNDSEMSDEESDG